MALVAVLDLMIPALSFIGAGALVAVALVVAFPEAVVPRLAAFFSQIQEHLAARRRARSARLARRIPR